MYRSSVCCLRAVRQFRLQQVLPSTHVQPKTGLPVMVDVHHKLVTRRTAVAQTSVICPRSLWHVLPTLTDRRRSSRRLGGTALGARDIMSEKKGSVLATASVAGTLAAKQTPSLIPFCHHVPLESCTITFSLLQRPHRAIVVTCAVGTNHKTGVEMEALVGASVAGLTVYDMLKGIPHAQADGLRLGETRLVLKRGGKSDVGTNSVMRLRALKRIGREEKKARRRK